MVGIDIMKDFGNSPVPPEFTSGSSGETSERLNNTSLLRELTLYYRLDKRFGKTAMTMYAGIFPRRFTDEKEYSKAFFSDSLAFYDNNLEGLLSSPGRKRISRLAATGWDNTEWQGVRNS